MPDQQQLIANAWQQLAIIGGALVREDDVTFNGTAWNIPAIYKDSWDAAAEDIARMARSRMEMTQIERTFKYRPLDGAHATYQMLKQHFGYAQAHKDLFGPPPNEVTISVGFVDDVRDENGDRIEKKIAVPFETKMVLPSLRNGTLYITQVRTPQGLLFKLVANCMKMHEKNVTGFFDVVEQYLKTNSIYRGKCFNSKGGFVDTDKIVPEKFVYTDQVWADLTTWVLSPMRDRDLLKSRGYAGKRANLLSGEFGGGKTGFGEIAAKSAVANKWSALMCAVGDDPFEMIETAKLYSPCFFFCEDVDQIVSLRNEREISRLLDVIDGAGAKDMQLVAVFTTNNKENIPAGMFRPGRFHRVIEIGPMDRAGVEKLARQICGTELAVNVDFDQVYEATAGYMPAFVREGLEGAVRYSIALHQEVVPITTDMLVFSLGSLRTQHAMLMAAMDKKPELPALDQSFREMMGEQVSEMSVQADIDYSEIYETVDRVVESRINGATIVRESDGSEWANIATN